ncbi:MULTISPECIES: DUF4142 domain-containing protein [unclassified Streptosporangium]|uniref:DUF4142 domain-containing protein n=1 Tax=unclassified Streptosporangium TaxID=2632669 RepID=UPI002E2E1C0F|nr:MULTISPECIES: DUF4142 domain-containing protein [unclassified Streptosporangium]
MVRKMIILLAVAVTVTGGTAGAAVSPTPQTVSQQDKDFLVQAHQANLAEIEGGKAAEAKTAEPEGRESAQTVRDLGERFVVDHTNLDQAVRQVADRLGVKLPDQPTAAQREQLDKLTTLSGADFDKAWISEELEGHRETLTAIDKEIKSGSSPEVKKLATDARPIVQEHVDLLLHAEETPTPAPSES